MRRERRIRLRWDRIGAALATGAVVLLVMGRALTAGPPAAGAAPVGATAAPAAVGTVAAAAALSPIPPDPLPNPFPNPSSGGCPAVTAGVVDAAPGEGRTVALTFDDGPGEWTAATLDVLQRYGVSATFFVVGRSVQAHPGLLTRIVAEGHQIGNHTWSHRPPPAAGSWPGDWRSEEYDATEELLIRLTGSGTCWFRPPQGVVGGSVPAAEAGGFTIALWSVDSLDWQVQAGAAADPADTMRRQIGENAVAGLAQEHPIVLLHDGGGFRGATVAALPYIIERYDNLGYRFVRLDGR